MNNFLPAEALVPLAAVSQTGLADATGRLQDDLPPGSAVVNTSDDAFGRLVSDGLSRVNSQLIASEVDLQKLAVGDAPNLHQIMINLEESRLSFQLMMQVRTRLLEAYQDVMKMPI